MYLLIFTIIYCVITQLFNIGYGSAMGFYLIVFGLLKGFYSEALGDVFNWNTTKSLYKKFSGKNSFFEWLSLLLIYLNAYVIDYEPFTLFEFFYLFIGFILVYRFLFWGVLYTLKN